MKRLAITGLLAVILLVLASPTFAGDRGRGRWEGFAIGLGAVTIYNLFEHGLFSPVIPPHRVYKKHRHYHPPVILEPSGHWEIRREWIPERRERIWISGHYENGYWVKGHYETRIYPGHWVRRKVWVEHYYHEKYHDDDEHDYDDHEEHQHPKGKMTEYRAYDVHLSVQR